MRYVGSALKAGHYFIAQISHYGYNTTYVNSIRQNSITFTVNPGEIIYLGEFHVNDYGALKHNGYDKERAADFLNTFPNLKGDLKAVNIEYKDIKNPQ